MRVVIKSPNQGAIIANIDNTLECLQRQVGGYIELHRLDGSSTCIVCNEDAIALDLMSSVFSRQYGVIRGRVIFLKLNNLGNFTGLSEDEAKSIVRKLSEGRIPTC